MLEDTDWELDENSIVANSNIGGNDIVLAYVRPKLHQNQREIHQEQKSVDRQSYRSSGSESAGVQGTGLAIIKRFDFESKLQRMSVIVKNQ